MMLVLTKPGQRTDAFTFAPTIASSWCSDSVIVTTANFVAWYTAPRGSERCPAIEAVLTTCPSVSCWSRMGTKVRMPWITPQRLTPSTHCQFSRVCCHERRKSPPTPALLQTTCTAPKASSVFSARASTSAARVTSVRTVSVDAPFALRARSAVRSAPSSTSARATFMPAAAKRSARASPMPLAAPVTTATRPSNSFMRILLALGRATSCAALLETPPRDPARNATAVRSVLLTEARAERGLLVEHDEQVKGQGQTGSVGEDRLAGEEEPLADDHRGSHGSRCAVAFADETSEESNEERKAEKKEAHADPARRRRAEERRCEPPARQPIRHEADDRPGDESDEEDRAEGRPEKGALRPALHGGSDEFSPARPSPVNAV